MPKRPGPRMGPHFDPASGTPVDQHVAVFPDANALITESIVKYGIDEQEHAVVIICIRTAKQEAN